jgi:hypothetical protein
VIATDENAARRAMPDGRLSVLQPAPKAVAYQGRLSGDVKPSCRVGASCHFFVYTLMDRFDEQVKTLYTQFRE